MKPHKYGLGTILAGVLAGVVASTPAAAQQAPLSPAEATAIKAEVGEAATTYFRYISERNVVGVVEKSFVQPSITIGANGVSLRAPDQQKTQFEANQKRLIESGWDRSVWSSQTVCVLNANSALVSGTFNRLKKDGSLHSAGSETILYAKVSDGWRIVSIMTHDAGRVISCTG